MSTHLNPKKASRVIGFIALLLVIVSFLPGSVRSQSGQRRDPSSSGQTADPVAVSGEILIAQFALGPDAVTTQHEYSGPVTLTISGIGQASATAYSDAFYILTDNAGNPVTPWRPTTFYNWVLWINGQHAETLIPGQQVPSHRSDHTYTFTINAPGGHLTLGVGDVGTGDNTGSYVITIEGSTSCTSPYFSQRDPRWINHPLRSDGSCSAACTTIGACGCTLTASAMVLAYYGANLTPATLSDCMDTAACPFTWETGAACSGGNATFLGRFEFDWSRLDQEINQNGRPVVVGMHLDSDPYQTHWVLATSGQGSSPGNYLVHDPWPLAGANTNLAVLTRQGYVLDYIVLYDGEPVCTAATETEQTGAATLLPVSQSLRDGSQTSAVRGEGPIETATPSPAQGPDVISGSIVVYHMELTAVIVQLSATSTAGNVTHMQVWTDSGPAPAWQPFSTLAWTPWQPGDLVHVRFRDAAGNISAPTSDSIRPDYNPGPLPILTPTPTPTPTATPSVPARTVFIPLVERYNPPISRFMALWRNENPSTPGIPQAAIRSQGNTIYVHMWGRCTPTDCDWGETTTTTADALDGTLNLTWTLPYKVETQQVSVLGDNRLRVAGHAVYNDGRPPRNYVEHFAPPTPQDIAYAAIRLENLELDQSVYAVGDVILASAEYANRSSQTLQLVSVAPFPYCTLGGQQQWIERLGPDPSIPPFVAAGIYFDGSRYAAGGGVLGVASCSLAPGEARAAYEIWNGTTGFPVGNYRFYMEYKTLDNLVMQSEVVPFEVISAMQPDPR